MNTTHNADNQAVAGQVERPVRPLIGCDELRTWLIAQGFRVAPNRVVVQPWRIEDCNAPDGAWESAEVEVTGEAGGHWYRLKSYGLKPVELMGRLHEIEAALIAAWNALRPNVRPKRDTTA